MLFSFKLVASQLSASSSSVQPIFAHTCSCQMARSPQHNPECLSLTSHHLCFTNALLVYFQNNIYMSWHCRWPWVKEDIEQRRRALAWGGTLSWEAFCKSFWGPCPFCSVHKPLFPNLIKKQSSCHYLSKNFKCSPPCLLLSQPLSSTEFRSGLGLVRPFLAYRGHKKNKYLLLLQSDSSHTTSAIWLWLVGGISRLLFFRFVLQFSGVCSA